MDGKRVPLSDSQLGVYLECINNPESCKYNIPFEYVFPKESIDTERLTAALNRVIARFSAFRAFVEIENGVPVTACSEKRQAVKPEYIGEEDYKRVYDEFVKPFAFNGTPLSNFALYETEKNIYILLQISHIFYDGFSAKVFENALTLAYEDKELPEETDSNCEVSEYEAEYVNSENAKADYDYFENYIGGIDADCSLIADVSRNEYGEKRGIINVALESGIDEVTAFAKKTGVTENVVIMSAFTYALAKNSGSDEVCFTSIHNGRYGKNLNNSIGMFVKTFPVYAEISEDEKITDFVSNLRKRYIETMTHTDIPFVELVKKHSIPNSVKYVYDGALLLDCEVCGVKVRKTLMDVFESVSDLDAVVSKNENGYILQLQYRKAKYSQELIESFGLFCSQVLKEMLKCETFAQAELTGKKHKEFINSVNKTEFDYPKNKTVTDYLDEVIASGKNRVAVSYKEKSLTYSEFDIVTKKLASYIHSLGIGRDDFVSILIPRNELMPVTAFGAVRAGSAYQPLDPTYPAERLNFMIKDCKAKLLIADRSLRSLVNEYDGKVLFTDEIDSLPKADDFKAEGKPGDAAVIIYTSGTTGTPKGCVLENRNIVSFFNAHSRVMKLDCNSKVATYASFGFDAGVMDVFTTAMAGGELCVIPDEIRLDLAQMDKFYCENGITQGFMTTQVGRMFAQGTKCKTLKHFLVGGEKLVPFKPQAGFEFINGYGPSETLAYVCSYSVRDDSPIQPIGKPGLNTKLYVTDKKGRLLPPGACGELCISGGQVGRGYLGRPEKTAEVFVENGFSDEAGYERMYKSGDIVRLLPSGNIDFVGRRDGQVKIRGFRVELTEVEQVIRSLEGIKDATVQAFDAPAGGKFIAAYVVSDEEINIDRLNEYIGSQKPAYMIPEVTVQIDKIPLNVNGKVDKKKLPKAEKKFEDNLKPQNETQQKIFDITASVIGTKDFGINTSLRLAGLTSIGSIRLNSMLSDEFGVSVQIKELMENDTVEKLEKFLLSKEDDSFEIQESYPLTKTQEGIYIECLSAPDSTVYNIPLLLRIKSDIDIEKLKNAVVKAVEAHPYIKTVLFDDGEGNILQKRNDSAPFTAIDIEEITVSDIDSVKESLISPFNLLNSRLFRFKIIKADYIYLLCDIHHIISDGTSLAIICRDISAAYTGAEIEKESFSGYEVSLAEQKSRKSDELAKAKEYYDKILSGFDTDFLPGRDIPFGAGDGNGNVISALSKEITEKAAKYCEENGISLNGFMCAAFGYLLAEYNASDYSIFTTVYNGRNSSATKNTASMLVKTLPVFVKADDCSPGALASDIAGQLTDSMANDIYSFAEISREYGLKADIMFVYQGESFSFDSFCGFKSEDVKIELSALKAPVSFQVYRKNRQFIFDVDYDASSYSAKYIKTLVEAFKNVIEGFTVCEKLSEIAFVSQEMIDDMEEFNKTEIPYDKNKNIVDFFHDSVRKYPDKVALSFRDRQYTYRDVAALTKKLASFIASKGIGKNDFVSVLIGRNEYMSIAAFGAIEAGVAFQPLDPTYPKERINFMISDVSSKLLILDRGLEYLADDYKGDMLFTDEIADLKDETPVTTEISTDSAVLIIYTSGTTGTPKGCVHENRSLVCFVHNHTRLMELDATSRMAFYASFGFDAGVMDILTSFMVGATLYIIPDDIRLDIAKMENFFSDNGITYGFMTTQVGRMFSINTKCKTLKHFLMGGEKLVPFMPPEGIICSNGYGPSETIGYISKYDIIDDNKFQPIGKAFPNTKLYIIDKYRRRLPFGASGELCIAGGQVGRGYLGRPEKTAEAFVENPFCNEKGYERMYRTGDVIRLLTDGNYDFVGRKDGQVKIRGFRVELTEIEQIIRRFDGIKDATVQAFDSPAGGKFITAYIVSDKKIDIEEMNAFIAAEKPPYMVPEVTMQIEKIPLNVNSKVDKRKLPKPERTVRKAGAEPANEVEESICEIFESILGIEKVYADDDFFAIGGTSIAAVQAVVKLGNAGFSVVFKNIFDNPTPQKLAEFIAGGKENDIFAPSGEEKAKYDYSSLDYNIIENLPGIRDDGIGDVLLTGVTGFLGSHLLKEILNETDGRVIALVRSKTGLSAQSRFEMMMTYYFEDWYNDRLAERVTVVDGELGDSDMDEKLKGLHFDTIINCAANVRHFAEGNNLINDNFAGVENLITLAEKTKTRLVQISSLSVCGESVNGNIPKGFVFKENHLNIGQSLENKYVYSKYLAEQAIIDAISRGRIRGKIIRLGNLMARDEDSEFQINASSNGFLKQFIGYKKLGCYPVDMMDANTEFSPIDSTARAVRILSGTQDEYTVFHAKNCHELHYGYFLLAMKNRGVSIDIVESSEFEERFKKVLQNEKDLSDYTGFIAYMNKTDSSPTDITNYSKDADEATYNTRIRVSSDTEFTTKALYRLGFAWPLLSSEYFDKMVEALIETEFFE